MLAVINIGNAQTNLALIISMKATQCCLSKIVFYSKPYCGNISNRFGNVILWLLNFVYKALIFSILLVPKAFLAFPK